MRALSAIFLWLLVCAGCASLIPEQPTQVPPTATELPSETPTETATPTMTIDYAGTAAMWITGTQNAMDATQTALAPTPTPTLTPTETPNVILTEFARMAAANAAAQQTIIALQLAQNSGQSTRTLNIEAAPTTTLMLTMTPVPTAEPTVTPTPTPDGVMPIPATILYARLPADLYTCPSRGCELRARLDIGVPMVADGTTNGEAINGDSPLWYRLNFNGEWVFIYGAMTTTSPPTPIPLGVIPRESTVMPLAICPRNCTEAVAWGISAQQAASCGLDRDGDGVACYGD